MFNNKSIRQTEIPEPFLGFKSDLEEVYPRGSDTRKDAKHVAASLRPDASWRVDLTECLGQGVAERIK